MTLHLHAKVAPSALLLAFLVGPAQPAAAQTRSGSEFPQIAQVAQGYQPLSGFVKLHVNPKKHKILAEIPRSLQKRPFLLATSITGGSYTGWQWDTQMVYWERLDRRLLLVEPQIRYKASGSTISEVVKRTYRDRIITTVPIIAADPTGSVLIDLTGLFAGRASLFIGSLARGVDASLTKIAKVKTFPRNVEIELDLATVGGTSTLGVTGAFGPSSGSGLAVHYSLSELPQTGYRPRPADDRIGYFITAHKDLNRNPKADTTFVRFINRWQLEKADKSLALSPPKEPITFYIEKTVPVRYRRYVKAGILEWNKAFERIGILDAVVVYQQTDSRFADLDPEDVRYNFFRWVTSETSFAMGPSRVHPETGQILDADVIFDESMVRDWLAEYARLIESGPVKELHPSVRSFLAENPHRHPMRRWKTVEQLRHELAHAGSFAVAPESGECAPQAAHLSGHHLCDFGHGMRHQVSFGVVALRTLVDDLVAQPGAAASRDAWPEEFVGQVIKEVVMHEVGHTLGLRHNFKGSSWISIDKINDPKNPSPVHSASIMDYNPTNISPKGMSQGFWNMRTIGPYDHLAIEYGYTLKTDAKELARIASQVSAQGLPYATDEDATSSDPYVNRFDQGTDPLAFARRRVDLVRQMMLNIVERTVKPGQGYQRARETFDMLLYEQARVSRMAARFVGGHVISRDHRGDPKARPPVVPVEAAKQREALTLLAEYVFGADSFRFSPELLRYLAAGRWYHWGSSDPNTDPEYPIHDRILQFQLWSLFDLINPRTLTLVADAEMRVAPDEDALTIPELLGTLTSTVWSEIDSIDAEAKYTNRKPLIPSVRRNLQQEYVGELIALALEGDSGASPHSARTQAWLQLRRLAEKITTRLGPQPAVQLDDYSLAHLLETSERIAKALEAGYSRNGGGGGGSILILGRPSGATN